LNASLRFALAKHYLQVYSYQPEKNPVWHFPKVTSQQTAEENPNKTGLTRFSVETEGQND